MKIHLDVDVTPQELRTFMGLPDVEPLQREMLELMRRNLTSAMDGFDTQAMLKTWMSPSMQNWDAMQKGFWTAFSQAKPSEGGKE